MKKLMKRLTALCLAFLMSVSVFAVTAAAEGKRSWRATVPSSRTFRHVTVIGDSIPSGYGLNGLIPFYPYTLENYMRMSGPFVVPGSYPDLVGKAVGAKWVYKLAREAYTTINILRILDPSYEEAMNEPRHYYDRFVSDLMGMAASSEYPLDMPFIRVTATQAVKNSDAIIINLANNDTFSLALGEPIFKSMYYAGGMTAMAALSALEGKLQTIGSLEEWVEAVGGIHTFERSLWRNEVQYEENFDRLIKRIRELNPKAEIYVVGMYNLFGQNKPEWGLLRNWTARLNVRLIRKLKRFYTKKSAYRNEIHYVSVVDTDVWNTWPMYSPFYYMNFLVQIHPTPEGHLYMANQILNSMNQNG